MDAADWSVLGEAMRFYEAKGYRPVDLPWFQPLEILSITCADKDRILAVDGFGGLVGSAEQSFLAADLAGTLGRGRFVACTPCFRNEPVVDRTHRIGFMKVELYANEGDLETEASRMLDLARRFMETVSGMAIDVEATEEGRDLSLGGVEVGSYGTRRFGPVAWTYGTGVAEPRFTTAARMRSER